MKVRRCVFRDFFARHDATLVTPVMCASDVNGSGLRDARPAGHASSILVTRSTAKTPSQQYIASAVDTAATRHPCHTHLGAP
jgi:hypothetical protein